MVVSNVLRVGEREIDGVDAVGGNEEENRCWVIDVMYLGQKNCQH